MLTGDSPYGVLNRRLMSVTGVEMVSARMFKRKALDPEMMKQLVWERLQARVGTAAAAHSDATLLMGDKEARFTLRMDVVMDRQALLNDIQELVGQAFEAGRCQEIEARQKPSELVQVRRVVLAQLIAERNALEAKLIAAGLWEKEEVE